MEKIKSKPGLLKFYWNCPQEVKDYFDELERLIDNGFSLDLALAYAFTCVERAHVNSLYCGIVKRHQVDSGLARRAVRQFHMQRSGFREKFLVIYGERIPESTIKLLVVAEAVRDSVLHGKGGTPEQKRNAIAHVLEYAVLLNEKCAALGGPEPFGKLRGFKGAAQGLDKKTSHWVLLGMGFLKQPSNLSASD